MLFLILPVTALMVVMGVAGFFYTRDLLLDQWHEAALPKLQRAAHQMGMHLAGIKESIRLFHETSGAQYDESFHAWALECLSRREGVIDVKLSWKKAADTAPAGAEKDLRTQPPGRAITSTTSSGPATIRPCYIARRAIRFGNWAGRAWRWGWTKPLRTGAKSGRA
jgi:hypothetical protein